MAEEGLSRRDFLQRTALLGLAVGTGALVSGCKGTPGTPGAAQSGAALAIRLWETNGTTVHDLSTVNNAFDGTWKHLALTYDRVLGQARVYVNGVLVLSQNVGSFVAQTDYNFVLGSWSSSYLNFAGQLDEVSLYRRPLDPEEVNNIYASGSAGKCPNNSNTAPLVYAGPDQFVTGVPGTALLAGQVADDGLPAFSSSNPRLVWTRKTRRTMPPPLARISASAAG